MMFVFIVTHAKECEIGAIVDYPHAKMHEDKYIWVAPPPRDATHKGGFYYTPV